MLERVLLPGFDAPWLRRAPPRARRGAPRRARTARPHRLDAGPHRRTGGEPAAGGPRALPRVGLRAADGLAGGPGNVAEALRTFDRLRDGDARRAGHGAVAGAARRRTSGCSRDGTMPRPLGLPLPSPLERIAAPPFVGRSDVLSPVARAIWTSGERRFVFLAGEPGIGKTSLLATFAREAANAARSCSTGARMRTRCRPTSRSWRCCRTASRTAASTSSTRTRPARRARPVRVREPPAASRTSSATGSSRPSSAALSQLTQGGGSCSCATTCTGPTGRRSSSCATSPAPPRPERLLVVGAYREAELEPPLSDLIADLRREQCSSGIPLRGLDEADTASHRGRRAWNAAHGCTSLTNGNPLFLLAKRDEDDAPRIKDVVRAAWIASARARA